MLKNLHMCVIGIMLKQNLELHNVLPMQLLSKLH